MLTYTFSPFPSLEDNRLLLRRLTENDAPQVFEMRSNPMVMKFIPRPLAKNLDDALELINLMNTRINENEGINWGITIKGNDKIVGYIGLFRMYPENYRAEIGYMLLPEFQNQNIVSDAIKLVLNYGFTTLQLNSIEAILDPENYSSERVLQKNGFVKEAHLLENEFWDGKFLDTYIYSILKRNF